MLANHVNSGPPCNTQPLTQVAPGSAVADMTPLVLHWKVAVPEDVVWAGHVAVGNPAVVSRLLRVSPVPPVTVWAAGKV